MNYKVVPEIKARGWPVSEPGYSEAHRLAEEHERKRFGARRFKSLQKVISKKLPVGELAGSHTKKGQIIISDKIPEKYHAEIVEHEKFEHKRMIRKRKIRRSKRR